MTLEINVKFNIGDRVVIKKPLGVAAYSYYTSQGPELGTVIGYVIHKTKDITKVYYKVDIDKVGRENKKYPAASLELYTEEE